MTPRRTAAVIPVLGLVVSMSFLGVFVAPWFAFDFWDRVLAVLLVLSVWGVVGATIALFRQADRTPNGGAGTPG